LVSRGKYVKTPGSEQTSKIIPYTRPSAARHWTSAPAKHICLHGPNAPNSVTKQSLDIGLPRQDATRQRQSPLPLLKSKPIFKKLQKSHDYRKVKGQNWEWHLC